VYREVPGEMEEGVMKPYKVSITKSVKEGVRCQHRECTNDALYTVLQVNRGDHYNSSRDYTLPAKVYCKEHVGHEVDFLL
jgi:hypothetical protein